MNLMSMEERLALNKYDVDTEAHIRLRAIDKAGGES